MGEGDAGRGAYGVREAADLLGMSPGRLRSWVRAGLVAPERSTHGRLRFSFRDLAFLRRVRDLGAARIPPRRVRSALQRLRARLPENGDLSSLPITAAVGQVVVREGHTLWSPESGQCVFDFGRERANVVSFPPCESASRDRGQLRGMDGADWYRLGCDLESTDPARAQEAYRIALELAPGHAEARVNLGCLLHEGGALCDAEAQYRAALELRPDDATARFDLAVVLEDQSRDDEARAAYEASLEADPGCAEAHYNLARLLERAGDPAGTVRHLTAYRRLVRE